MYEKREECIVGLGDVVEDICPINESKDLRLTSLPVVSSLSTEERATSAVLQGVNA